VAALVARRPWLIAAVSIGLIVVVLIGGRAAWRLGYRLLGPPPPPRQTDVSLIADWMSVPYVSRAYRVPEPELYQALGVEPEGRRMRRLRDIARETDRDSDEVVEIVRQAITTWQASHPGPPRPTDAPDPPLPPPGPGEAPPDGPRPTR
jgi:hypothetical protein